MPPAHETPGRWRVKDSVVGQFAVRAFTRHSVHLASNGPVTDSYPKIRTTSFLKSLGSGGHMFLEA